GQAVPVIPVPAVRKHRPVKSWVRGAMQQAAMRPETSGEGPWVFSETSRDGRRIRREPEGADSVAAGHCDEVTSCGGNAASGRVVYHEISATSIVDPVTGHDAVILMQHDVTAKVTAERHLALVMETEHRLLEQLYPRHILVYLAEEWTAGRAEAAADRTAREGYTQSLKSDSALR
ncbi:hypothetical protein VaNZ11_004682, partial [Volvox africanus]